MEIFENLQRYVPVIAGVVITLVFLGIFVSILVGSGQLTIAYFQQAAKETGANITIEDYTQKLNVGTVFSMSNIVIIMSMVGLIIAIIIGLYHYFTKRTVS